MRLRAHHKLFLSYSVLVAAVVVVLSVGVEVTLRQPLIEQAAEELGRELALGRALYDGAPDPDPDLLARRLAGLTGHRVTVIDRSGVVLGDSGVEPEQVAALENHLDRPEVQGALEIGTGTAVRHSVSVDAELLYAAVVTDTGPVLRFAVGIEAIDEAVASVRRRILEVGGVALLLAAVFSLAFSVAVTRPLRRLRDIAAAMGGGDLTARVRLDRRDELGELAEALDGLAEELQRRIEQLDEERQETAALVDSMAEAVVAVDADGTVRRANPAAREIFGSGGPLEGMRPEAVARGREFLELVRHAFSGDSVPPAELVHQGRSLLATARALPRGGAVLVFLDMTELRRLEGIRRDFVANASHELKTPLTVIRGQAETLLDEELPPDLRSEFTERLHANVERLHRILEDLLDLSRIESGGWTPTSEPVRIEEVAEEAWGAFGGSDKGIAFRVDVEGSVRQIEADPRALAQIFQNLLDNAARHTPPGGRVQVVARAEPTDGVTIEVRDTGSGIPAADLDRIFERFYRVDPARSRAEGGTGLGLAIVRHLVEGHGGRIEAESELGEGTTIRFVLPRGAGGAPAATSPPAHRPPSGGAPPRPA